MDALTVRREALLATVRHQRDQLRQAADDVDTAWQAALAPARLGRLALVAIALAATTWTLRRRGWRTATVLWLVSRLGRLLWRRTLA